MTKETRASLESTARPLLRGSGGGTAGRPTAVESADRPARSSKLEALAQQRVDQRKKTLELMTIQYTSGHASLGELMHDQREVALAAREGLRGDKRRQELAAYRDATLEANAAMKRRYTMAAVNESDLRRAEAALTEAEYWLVEASEAP